MRKSELHQAEELLADWIDKSEQLTVDGGGYCLSVEWTDGGHHIFYSLEEVRRSLGRATA